MRYFTLFILIVLLTRASNSYCQNLFDEEHTSSFANYLYKSSQFKLAADEYERLVFMKPANDTAKLLLLKSYRKSGLIDKGIMRTEELFPDKSKLPSPIFDEYAFMLVSAGKFKKADTLIKFTPLLMQDKRDYLLMNVSLLTKDWKDAKKFYLENGNDSLQSFAPYAPIIAESENLRHRSAGVSMLFSAVVPGTGKAYSSEWKDGLISLVLVGICTYQSYRGFNRDGVSSAYGWIYGSLGFGFYLGNIYGSFKSAKKFNAKYEDALVKSSRDLFINNL